MPKTISASKAKNQFGSIIRWVIKQGDEVVVESHGEPRIVIMPFAEYDEFRRLREEARRKEALIRLKALGEKIRARNRDLTPEEGDRLAGQFSKEFVQEMVEEGKIQFEP
jgi:prevent-host-death family protein